MIAPHKVYPVKKNNHNYYLIKYKDPITSKWLSKYAPVDQDTPAKVEVWFSTVFAPSPANLPPSKKSIHNLYPLWEKHRQSILSNALSNAATYEKVKGKQDHFPNIQGIFKNHILSSPIAHLDLETELEPKHCGEFIRSLDRAPNTVRNVVQNLKDFIDLCRMEQFIDFRTTNLFSEAIIKRNINDGNGIQKVAGNENVIALTSLQLNQLLSNERVLWRRRIRYWLAFTSGLRDAELAGLQWRDLSLTDPIPMVKVDRQIRRHIKPPSDQFKPPKRLSYRSIPLHPKVIQALLDWQSKGWLELVGRMPSLEDPVFPTLQGLFFQPNSAAEFKEDLIRSNLSPSFQGVGGKSYPFDFHSTRRTFASLLESLNTDRERIGALLGHSSKGVTANHYIMRNLQNMTETIAKLPLTAPIISVSWTPTCDNCGKASPPRHQILCNRCRTKKKEVG